MLEKGTHLPGCTLPLWPGALGDTFQFLIYSPTPFVCVACSVCVDNRGRFTKPGSSFHDVGPGLEVRSSIRAGIK